MAYHTAISKLQAMTIERTAAFIAILLNDREGTPHTGGMGSPYAQTILFFFCRPCGAYHEKTHPHYRAMKRRKGKRLKAKQAEQRAEA
jgi:hypothetical protein